MQAIGQQWVSAHQRMVGQPACQVCHGMDYRGAALFGALAARTLWRTDRARSRPAHRSAATIATTAPTAAENGSDRFGSIELRVKSEIDLAFALQEARTYKTYQGLSSRYGRKPA